MDTSPTSDEKIMAALAHGSVFLMFFGPVVPVILWATQRKKSKYVCFHALQAMGYQALLFWLWIVATFLIVIFSMCLAFPLGIFITRNSSNVEFSALLVQIFIMLFIFGFLGLFFLTGILGGVFCLIGRDFRYPLIGKWLERYLPYSSDPESQIDETREDNWVAAVCHATAVLQIWGIMTPLIVWFTQKERSARLRFQALQAAIYQGIALAAYLLGMVLYMGTFFAMFFIPVIGWSASRGNGGELPAPAGIAMLVLFGIIMLIWLLMLLLLPVYYLLSGLASVRVIQGRPFHYPIIGRIMEKRMSRSRTVEPLP